MGVVLTSAEGETPDCIWALTLTSSIRRWPSTPFVILGGGIFELGLGNPWCLLLLVIA